jgi:hypothetical protein
LHDQIVDAHRHQIDADRVQNAGVDGDLELGADAVGRGNEDRVLEAGGARIEGGAETADFAVGAGPLGRAGQRFDRLNQRLAGVDVDPRLAVVEAVASAGYGVLVGAGLYVCGARQ